MSKRTSLISFLLGTAVLFVYFACNGYYPFGERSVAWCDMEQQYIPLLLELKEMSVLSGGGGGMNFWGVFFFFVSSPFSLLVFLTKTKNVIYLVNFLTALKFGLCAFTFSIYLKYDNRKINPVLEILLSLMYAYSGYNIMYYQNSMWLDIVYMFPIFMIAFRELIKNGRTMPYIICLSAMVYLNYYISYMIVIFTIISSSSLLLNECPKSRRYQNSLKFMISSFISALITCPVWLVSLIEVLESGRKSIENDGGRTGFFANILDKYCLISAVSVVILAVIIMIKNKNLFNQGIRRFYRQMTFILLLSAFIDPFNKMWHTGSYQAYPLRYGFIIIFICLVSVGQYISDSAGVKSSDKKTVLICFSFVLIYITAVILINSEKLLSYVYELHISGENAVIIICFGIIALTVNIFAVMSFKQRQITSKVLNSVIGIIFLFETVFSLNIYMRNAPDVTARYKVTAELSDKINDDSFFRVKLQKRYFFPNMLEGMGYNTTSHYTSLTNQDFMNAMKRMGYSSYWLDVSSNGGTLVTDAFLMNKYIISIIGDFIGKGVYSSVNPLKVYINEDILDGAFISDVLPEDFGEYSSSDRMDFSQLLCSKLLNSDDIIAKTEDFSAENVDVEFSDNSYKIRRNSENEDSVITYNIYAEKDNILYFDIFGDYSASLDEKYYGACDIYVNGELIEESYPSRKMNGIINLGQFRNKNVEVKIKIRKNFETKDFGLYLFDTYKFQNQLQSVNTAKIEKNGNTVRISGEGEGYLYIPLAYNKGYTAQLNGKRCKIIKCMDSFMAVKLDGSGEFEFYAEYYPRGIKFAVVLSLMGFILLVIYQKNINIISENERLKKSAYTARLFMTVFVMFVIYAGALVFWII